MISKMLSSLLCQTYSHGKIFVLIVDNESSDNTIQFAKEVLDNADFRGYKIIQKKCNIPQGRNICIENMVGDKLLFWDSDVIMQPTSISRLLADMEKTEAGIVVAGNSQSIFFKSIQDLTDNFPEFDDSHTSENLVLSATSGMGHTLISKKVFSAVSFDPALTTGEDDDFSVRARGKNFKIYADMAISAYDVNISREKQSDIHIDMPLQDAMSNMRKKSRAQAFGSMLNPTYSDVIRYFLGYKKRYTFYLGYIPTFALSILGLTIANLFLIAVFPVYLCLYASLQFKNRGVRKGCKAITRSFLVGVPSSIFILYYLLKRVGNSNGY
jgi:glycosyltransferase involved in cell wall biosynthesis